MSSRPTAEYAELLRSVEIFAGLDRVTLAKLAAHLEPVPVAAGATLIRQDDPPDGFYLISHGAFGIFAAPSSSADEVRLGTCSRGDLVGEMALLTDEQRSATVRAEGDGEVLRLDRAYFLTLVRQDPSVALAIAATLTRRLRAADAARLGIPTRAPLPADGLAPAERSAEQRSRALVDAVNASVGPARRWRRPSRALVGVTLAGLALGVGWGTTPPAGLSPAGWHALATLIAIVPVLALGALPDGAAALALAAVWVVGGVAPPAAALGGFATGSWVLTVTIFAVGAAIASCGLLYRLALEAVARAGGGFAKQAAALSVGGLVIGATIPNATGRVSLIAPATTEIAETLGYAAGSRAAAGLAMAVLAGFGQMVAPFLTSSSTALLAYALLPEASRVGLDWGTWALRALPANLVVLLGLLAIVVRLYGPARGASAGGQSRQLADALEIQRAVLGPPSRGERIAFAVAVALLAGFVTQPLHGLDPTWIGVAAFVVLASAGLLTADTLRAVNWNFVLLFGVLVSMADVFASAGLDRWLAELILGVVGGLTGTPVLFVGALVLLCYLLGLVLRWQAIVPLVTIALGPVASGAGIDPWVVAIAVLMAGNAFFLPYQSTIYLALYHGTGGHLFSHAQARPVAIAYAALTLLGLCASVPLWRAMGLL